jgi:phosphatidylglycerol:prolipoprotein diacylglycerol transferase
MELHASPYTFLMVTGIALSIWFWSRRAPRADGIGIIYFWALAGAFVGAKILYLLAEGWLHWNDAQRWIYLATGKTILGALLGGYVAVEIAKWATAYRLATGDIFATVAPLSIIIGRIGCLLHGCCLGRVCEANWYAMRDSTGVVRWPAVPMEIVFNFVAFVILWMFRRRNLFPGQHFHLYLMGYGLFRFAHEFLRDTPTIMGPFSGYHLAAVVVFFLGAIRFVQRQRNAEQIQPARVAAAAPGA